LLPCDDIKVDPNERGGVILAALVAAVLGTVVPNEGVLAAVVILSILGYCWWGNAPAGVRGSGSYGCVLSDRRMPRRLVPAVGRCGRLAIS
jgi:hypothetical protein